MTTTATRTAYATVGSFDHSELSKLATYRPLRDALSDFAGAILEGIDPALIEYQW